MTLNRILKRLCLAASILAAFCTGLFSQAASTSTGEIFKAPGDQAQPWVYWIWVNGNVEKEGIRADLEDMKRVGIGGVMLFEGGLYLPDGPARYNSDLWHENVQYAIKVCSELGIKFTIMNCAGWATAGGPWNDVERSMKVFTWSEKTISGGQPWNGKLETPPNKLDYYRDVAVIAALQDTSGARHPVVNELNTKVGLKKYEGAFPAEWDTATPGEYRSAQIIDISDKMSADGTLNWTPPAGQWRVFRFGYTTTARKNHPAPEEGTGLEVDKFDPEAVMRHLDISLGRIVREAGPEAGKALEGVLGDSWEAGPQNWAKDFPAQFKKRRGYDMIPYIPALTGRVIDSPGHTEAFLADFRRTLGELYTEYYFGVIQAYCHKHGMRYYSEVYGGIFDEPSAIEKVDFPMVEFWLHDLYKGFDYAPSVAHLTGKPLVMAEAFTGRPPRSRWSETPASLKALGDKAFTNGINTMILHSYIHQPKDMWAPGFTHGRYGTHIGRLNSWWPLVNGWTDYLRRSQLLLQHGRYVADILVLKDEQLKSEYRELLPPVLEGYKSDLISVNQLRMLSVKDGWLTTKAGARYRVMLLPDRWIAESKVIDELLRLKREGALMAGSAPFTTATLTDMSPEKMKAWKKSVETLMQGIPSSLEALDLGIKPALLVRSTDEDADVQFAQRSAADGDYYFIANLSGKPIRVDADFREGTRAPELWNPVNGKISDVLSYRVENGRTIIPLEFNTDESVFIVFRKARPKVWTTEVSRNGAPLATKATSCPTAVTETGSYTIKLSDGKTRSFNSSAPAASEIRVDGTWEVSFKAHRRAPKPVKMQTLASLHENESADLRYFTGIASYQNTVSIPRDWVNKDRRVILNLGAVHDIAEVTVNGKKLSILWMAPFTLDITDAVKAGKNEITIAVANRWINRLIGDEQLPADMKYSTVRNTQGALEELPAWWNDKNYIENTRKRHAAPVWKHYGAKDPLVPSGLVGPVILKVQNTLPAQTK